MTDTKKVAPGDWVRFYQNGELRIAEVRYVRKETRYPWEPEALTNIGAIEIRDIIEVRRAHE